MSRFPIERVSWIDSQGHGSWEKIERIREKPPDLRCESVGYLVHETDEYLTLCLSTTLEPLDSDVAGAAPLTIPKVAITARESIK